MNPFGVCVKELSLGLSVDAHVTSPPTINPDTFEFFQDTLSLWNFVLKVGLPLVHCAYSNLHTSLID